MRIGYELLLNSTQMKTPKQIGTRGVGWVGEGLKSQLTTIPIPKVFLKH